MLAYVIPGFGENVTDKPYKLVILELRKIGYNVVPVKINWARNTWENWKEEVAKTIKKNGHPDLVFGFSFGAMLALANSDGVQTGIFCSLSPYYQEDMPKLPKLCWKMLGKRRMDAFARHAFSEVRSFPKKSFFVYADKDFPLLKELIFERVKSISGKTKIIEAKNSEHYLGEAGYMDAVMGIFKKLPNE